MSKYGGVKGRGEPHNLTEGEEPHNLVERTLSHLWASRRGLLEMELFQVWRDRERECVCERERELCVCV